MPDCEVTELLDGAEERTETRPGTGGKLRILMVAPQPFFRPRGTPFSVLHRIRALLAQGHSVDIVTYPFGEDPALPGLRVFRAKRPWFVHDVRVGPSIAKIFLDIALYRATKRVLQEHSYDVLHTHEEAAFFGVGLAKKHGLLHVYDMHSSLPHQLSNFKAYDFGLFRWIFRGRERKVFTTADGVITICRELADIATAHCEDTPHAMIENTGDDRTLFAWDGSDPRADLSLEDKHISLYTGTFEAYQGLHLLLDAFVQVVRARPQAHLLLVGGSRGQVEEQRQRARDLGIADAVSFVGTVHPSHIPGYLRAADLIVSPRSRGTNTPLKIYNYMRWGVPLVATDKPTHTQTLTVDNSLLVPPTPEGFARGIQRLIDDPAEASRIGAAAARFAEEHFADADYVARVAGFYREVAALADPGG